MLYVLITDLKGSGDIFQPKTLLRTSAYRTLI